MKKRNGFTLIEILMVLILSVVLMSAALTSIVRSQQTFIFNGTLQQVQQMVREARSYAVTGKAQKDFTDYNHDGSTSDLVVPSNYGIHFVKGPPSKIILFADIHPANGSTQVDGSYDDPDLPLPAAAINQYKANKDVKLAEYTLPDGLTLVLDWFPTNILLGIVGTYDIFYSPIFADVTFPLPPPVKFFLFEVKEIQGDRKHCILIHRVSGIPEEVEKVNDSNIICS